LADRASGGCLTAATFKLTLLRYYPRYREIAFMSHIHIETGAKAKLTPADLVNSKPDECSLWRMEMVNCSYDYVTQTRRWTESEKIRQLMMTTGAPTSSTSFDGEKDE